MPELERPCCSLKATTETSGNEFVDIAHGFRAKLKEFESFARDFTDYIKSSNGVAANTEIQNVGETIAQSIIAMRHIEDARMRFGKVIQYVGPGISSYDSQPKGSET